MDVDRHILKSKIHRARVTDADPDYEGSLTIDQDLMEAADILPYERVQVLSVDTGARLETYAIPGARGTGTVCVNGAAARVIGKDELVIVLTYTMLSAADAADFVPRIVHVDDANRALKD